MIADQHYFKKIILAGLSTCLLLLPSLKELNCLMPESFEAGSLKGQHSKRINPNIVVNDCFTSSVVWRLAAGEREELIENKQFPALSLRGQIYHLQMHPSLSGQSNKRLHQEPGPPCSRGFTLSTSCQAHGTSCVRTASKAVWIFPALT